MPLKAATAALERWHFIHEFRSTFCFSRLLIWYTNGVNFLRKYLIQPLLRVLNPNCTLFPPRRIMSPSPVIIASTNSWSSNCTSCASASKGCPESHHSTLSFPHQGDPLEHLYNQVSIDNRSCYHTLNYKRECKRYRIQSHIIVTTW